MSSRKRRKPLSKGPQPTRLWPYVATFLAGGLVTFFLMGGLPALAPGPGQSSPVASGEPMTHQRAQLLATVLLPQANWERRDTALPMEWRGTLPATASLVQWNARVSAGIQGLGLDILDGREEVIPRSGRWPLQRLTLIVGRTGELIATIVVETSRSPSLPPPF